MHSTLDSNKSFENGVWNIELEILIIDLVEYINHLLVTNVHKSRCTVKWGNCFLPEILSILSLIPVLLIGLLASEMELYMGKQRLCDYFTPVDYGVKHKSVVTLVRYVGHEEMPVPEGEVENETRDVPDTPESPDPSP